MPAQPLTAAAQNDGEREERREELGDIPEPQRRVAVASEQQGCDHVGRRITGPGEGPQHGSQRVYKSAVSIWARCNRPLKST